MRANRHSPRSNRWKDVQSMYRDTCVTVRPKRNLLLALFFIFGCLLVFVSLPSREASESTASLKEVDIVSKEENVKSVDKQEIPDDQHLMPDDHGGGVPPGERRPHHKEEQAGSKKESPGKKGAEKPGRDSSKKDESKPKPDVDIVEPDDHGGGVPPGEMKPHHKDDGGEKVDDSQGGEAKPREGPMHFGESKKKLQDISVDMHEVYRNTVFDDFDGGAWKQGWEVTYDKDDAKKPENKLHVFVIPHSHCDPGWIMTYQEYYEKQTRNILTTIIDALLEDEKRRFIWAEISFFKLYWDEQDTARREQIKGLVKSGQFEFVTGGWVMNDEANTNIYAMISQLLEGLDWLNVNLGDSVPQEMLRPRHGWAIDPFGHTPTMAYVLKQLDFKSALIQRVHYRVKKYLAESQSLEFRWRQSWEHGDENDMLTHMMPFYSYDTPHSCGPNPAVCCAFDFARTKDGPYSCPTPWHSKPEAITSSNVDEKTRALVDQYRKKSELYKTNAILVPLGDDFRYQTKKEADLQFKNYEAIFKHANSDAELNVELKFGNLRDYFTHVIEAAEHDVQLPVLHGSFFTYADRKEDYWSGYFTTRAFYKNQDRILESSLFATEIAMAVAINAKKEVSTEQWIKFRKAQQNLGLFQHHDGITGTAKNKVVVDYGRRLLNAIQDSKQLTSEMLALLAKNWDESHELKTQYTQTSFDSLPERTVMESDYHLVVFNPRSLPSREVVRQRVRLENPMVSASNANDAATTDVDLQIHDESPSEGLDGADKVSIISFVAEVPPMSARTFLITSARDGEEHGMRAQWREASDEDGEYVSLGFEGGHKYNFDSTTGLLVSIETPNSDTEKTKHSVKEDFRNYFETGGAYLFMPKGPSEPYAETTSEKTVKVLEGPIVSEVYVESVAVKRTARVFSTDAAIEMEHFVDVTSLKDTTFVARYSTEIDNAETLYSDLNGFQMESHPMRSDMAIQRNFVPMPAMAALANTETGARFTIHSDHAAGVGSINPGEIEIMLDRTLTRDDERGLVQGIQDNVETNVKFRLLFETPEKAPSNDDSFAPSLLSHSTSDMMNHPLELFAVSVQSQSEAPQYEKELCPVTSMCVKPHDCDLRLIKWDVRESSQDAWIQRLRYDSAYGSNNLCTDGVLLPMNVERAENIAEIEKTLASMQPGAMTTVSVFGGDELSSGEEEAS